MFNKKKFAIFGIILIIFLIIFIFKKKVYLEKFEIQDYSCNKTNNIDGFKKYCPKWCTINDGHMKEKCKNDLCKKCKICQYSDNNINDHMVSKWGCKSTVTSLIKSLKDEYINNIPDAVHQFIYNSPSVSKDIEQQIEEYEYKIRSSSDPLIMIKKIENELLSNCENQYDKICNDKVIKTKIITKTPNVHTTTTTITPFSNKFRKKLLTSRIKNIKEEVVDDDYINPDFNLNAIKNDINKIPNIEFISRPFKNNECNFDCYLQRYRELRNYYGSSNIIDAEKHYNEFGKNNGYECSCPNYSDYIRWVGIDILKLRMYDYKTQEKQKNIIYILTKYNIISDNIKIKKMNYILDNIKESNKNKSKNIIESKLINKLKQFESAIIPYSFDYWLNMYREQLYILFMSFIKNGCIYNIDILNLLKDKGIPISLEVLVIILTVFEGLLKAYSKSENESIKLLEEIKIYINFYSDNYHDKSKINSNMNILKKYSTQGFLNMFKTMFYNGLPLDLTEIDLIINQ